MSDIEVGKPRITRKNPLLPTEKHCPNCLALLQTGTELGGWLITQDYYCTKCGYRGTIFLEQDKESKRPEGEGPKSTP